MRRARPTAAAFALACALATPGAAQDGANPGGRESYLSDQPTPLDKTIDRPRPWLEVGAPFLGTGPLSEGFELPGGAVWQPSLVVFGTYRGALQTFDDGEERFSEWANRLDLFANLQLSGTERLVVGLRPFDKDARYSGYEFEPEPDGWKDRFDANVEMVFFEGDFGELFPNLDLYDRNSLDYGFSIGRQPIELQDGMLLDDIIDSVGVVRNSLHTPWTSGLRVMALWGWNHVNRDDNRQDDSANLYALSASTDLHWTSLEADVVYVDADERRGDGLFGGIGAIQRFQLLGRAINTTFRVLGSRALDDEKPGVGNGVLLFTQVGMTPNKTPNWLYLNLFWAIGRFSSAARGPEAGGPLITTGLMYSTPELGRFGPALSNRAEDAVGAAVGYQMFFAAFRRQLVLELGARAATEGDGDAIAVGARFQQAFGRHVVLQLDGHVSSGEDRSLGYGTRSELVFKF
jgi:hypothetical protein